MPCVMRLRNRLYTIKKNGEIKKMIDSSQIAYNYIQKEPLSGSFNGMRYYIQKKEDLLSATVYPEPLCFVKTPQELKTTETFENSPEGLEKAVKWLDGQYASRPWK